jgi:hypothetical protein
MASPTQKLDCKPAKAETPQPDLCGQYRGIGIAAVAAAACAGKPKPSGPTTR